MAFKNIKLCSSVIPIPSDKTVFFNLGSPIRSVNPIIAMEQCVGKNRQRHNFIGTLLQLFVPSACLITYKIQSQIDFNISVDALMELT